MLLFFTSVTGEKLDNDGVTVRPGSTDKDEKEVAAEAMAVSKNGELEPGEIDPNEKPPEDDVRLSLRRIRKRCVVGVLNLLK